MSLMKLENGSLENKPSAFITPTKSIELAQAMSQEISEESQQTFQKSIELASLLNNVERKLPKSYLGF